MANKTSIEWTRSDDGTAGMTWNPTTGCDRISPGCDNCYALTMAKRLKGMGSAKYQTDGDPRTSGPGFGITTHPDTLTEPLRWKKPRKVFVNSMSDLFHARVPIEFIIDVWRVMEMTPQHTYQVLTKRPQRLRRALAKAHWVLGRTEPLPNVWLGTSVENQKYADLRIPALLDAPAAVRFLSCEPLLGPVDLSPWLPSISPMPVNDAPQTWDEWTWPDWVPAEVRNAIEDFWGADQGRSPRDWMRNMHEQGAPAFGATLRMNDGFGPKPRKVTGRFVHAWNNIGRLVLNDDPNRTFAYTSFGSMTRQNSQPLDWVIVGGESGPGARAFAPEWAANVAKTASDAGVPTFVKQLGTVWARDNKASDTKGGNPDDWPVELRVREYPQTQRAAA